MGNRRYIEDDPPPTYFKEWREFRELTQAEVEKLYGWPQSRVSNIENGRAIVTDHVLRALARAYRCSPGDLLDRPPPSPNTPDSQSSTDNGLGALHDALSALQFLAAEIEAIRSSVSERLDVLEQHIKSADASVAEALRDSNNLAETLQNAAGRITRARTRSG